MKNPNDITSKYYDKVTKAFKGNDVTKEEISLMTKLVKYKGKILDIGCGTGRHFLELEKLGYTITGIDESEGMLEVLKSKKLKESRVINANFLDFEFFNVKFDAIILFWNTFNEICVDDKKAKIAFKKFSSILKPNGIVIINSDDPKNINPEDINFENVIEEGNIKIIYNWNVKAFDKKNNLSTSEERIEIHKNDILYESLKTLIKQKWRDENEYAKLSIPYGFKQERNNLHCNDELYLVFRNLNGKRNK